MFPGDQRRCPPLGGDAKVLLDILEDAVAYGAGFFDVSGFEREAEALSRSIGFVHRDMAPPDTPVVPEMVVRIVIVDPHGDFGLLRHGMYVLFLSPYCRRGLLLNISD